MKIRSNKWKIKISDCIFIGVCILLIVGIICFRIWWRNTYYGVVVSGSSMRQTLEDDDELFVRYIKDGEKAERGDVIVVYTGAYEENGKGKYLIKRLIAVAGDKVRCTDGQVEICYAGTNAYVSLEETYAYYGNYKLSYDFAEYVVQEGEIFFLGDNRSGKGSSQDSRYKEGASNLKDSLYKETDICGIVPSWSIRHKSICKFFINNQTQNMQ